MFSELTYYVFLMVTAALYWMIPAKAASWRAALLALVGIGFYVFYAGSAILLLLPLTLATYAILFLGRSDRDRSTAVWRTIMTIVVSTIILGIFKYSRFVGDTVDADLRAFPAAPLAISFFTFEFIHVAAEVAKGNIRDIPFLRYLGFIFFYPTMVAGPIKRYEQFETYFDTPRANAKDVLEGLYRILLGLAKKVVIADNLNSVITEIGPPVPGKSPILLTIAIILYGFRIYFDFAGYSDIAIGSSRLFGIRIPENFLHPYRQRNIAAFWRHWHVSLSSWLVDYVYIPLGGNRRGFLRANINLGIVMLISGLWHGAAWNFVLWGAWHGLLLITHRTYTAMVMPKLSTRFVGSRANLFASYLLNMSAVWFGWMLFMWPLREVAIYLGAFI